MILTYGGSPKTYVLCLDVSKSMSARQKLETQLTENNIVKEVCSLFLCCHLYCHCFVTLNIINNYVASRGFRNWIC